jgi:hypothetical protein
VEYVVELARALRAMGAEDRHVFELAELVGTEGSGASAGATPPDPDEGGSPTGEPM